MSSPDLPFVLHGGDTEQAAMHNRAAALARIEFLSGVNLNKKSSAYLRALDLEMWQRWYRHEKSNKKIDEEFCQRAAKVIKDMEQYTAISVDEKKYKEARKELKQKEKEERDALEKSPGDTQDAEPANKQAQD